MVLKVLIVDDDYINRRLLISLLNKELYEIEIIESADGKDALERCHAHQDIQLILLDVEMPTVDGTHFLEHYRGSTTLPDIPIIAISSNDLRVKEILNLGANAFIVKPVTKEKLILALHRSLTG